MSTTIPARTGIPATRQSIPRVRGPCAGGITLGWRVMQGRDETRQTLKNQWIGWNALSSRSDAWHGKTPADVEAFILETVDMLHKLDDTSLHELTPLFHEHGDEQVAHSLRELLKMLGHDPDA
ncbi:hypothetical protein [Cryobacterium sp. TMT3-29-2]|uniref:hypothetical protein n=1 Tax=Cryobacterium sp. TMT3-29-2 TaxID=2555867 RepID=UPI00107407E6|nr:hypothetical protein [Cryobacterium sp. TMT3-29-2]TFC89467.1 hypothetical protein E3O67_06965 [Cryobacterium sp. TMT3-29-2]